MFFKSKIKSEINYLELTPVRIYEYEVENNGLVSVLVPKFNIKFFDRMMSRFIKSRHFKANLDEFGTETWLEINGINSVQKISEHLVQKFGEKINPVNERLTKFLSQLHN